MEKVYFLGEFGYGFRQLLPFLESFTEELEIITWPSLCKIIDLLWANKYKCIDVFDHLKGLNGTNRACTFFEDSNSVNIIVNLGYKNICVLDKDKDYLYDGAYIKFPFLKRKIMYGEQKKEKPYVSIFPRKRDRCSWKNNITEEHLKWIKKNYPNKEIVGHGLPEERIDLGIRYCKDIYEQINVLNNSETFICPASGMADLGLLCGCDLILTVEYPTIENVNPHKCSIKYWNDIK